MIGLDKPTRRRPIWEQFGQPVGDDWRAVLYAAGTAADERSEPLHAVRDLDDAVKSLAARDDAAAADLGDVVDEAKTAVYDAALVLGYALARTWPDRLDDLDAWPDRALALADLGPAGGEGCPSAPAGAAPPFEGETIADAVERSGSVDDRPYGWLELVAQVCWEESPHHHAFDGLDDTVIALCERDAPVPIGALAKLDNARIDEEVAALSYGVRLGYALGRFEHLPEPERLARARALAGLRAVVEPRPILTREEADELDAWRRPTRPATAGRPPRAEPGDADRIGAWLADNALADAAPAEVVARLLADQDALARLRPTPA